MITHGQYHLSESGRQTDSQGQVRYKENQNRNHIGLSQFGVPGRWNLPCNALRTAESIQMYQCDIMDQQDAGWEDTDQFPEIGHGAKIHASPFWLDVVPGV